MASTYLSRTPASTGNQKTWTLSSWVKNSYGGMFFCVDSYGASKSLQSEFYQGSDYFAIAQYASGASAWGLTTNRLFRDRSAWYHLVISVDTTQATSSDRVKIYINGVQETSFSTETYPSLNYDTGVNTAIQHMIGNRPSASTYFDGLMAHFHFIDGTAYDASAFGEYSATSGVWKPKTAPSVTYGTNGFFLKFANSAALGTDSSVNGNDLTVSGSGTQTLDNPSNVYCVNNVLSLSASGVTNANGNLSVTDNASNAWRDLFGTLGVSVGKWYWEQKIDNFTTGIDPHRIGICDAEYFNNSATDSNFEDAGISRAYGYCKTGSKINASSITSYGDSWTTGDIVGIAMDLDNGKIYFSKNGTWQNSGDPTSGATGTGSAFNVTTNYTYLPLTSTYYTDNRYSYNFGNGYFGTTAVSTPESDGAGLGKFEYAVPTGYYSLSTKNIITYG